MKEKQTNRDLTPVVTKRLLDNAAYFTLAWSRLRKVDKYEIINSVPAEAGIYELYYLDNAKKLNLMRVSRVWYGGLRSRLRSVTDPDIDDDPAKRDMLLNRTCYYRYSIVNSFADMQDILFFFVGRYRPGDRSIDHSGRYEEIYVEEISPDKIVTGD